MLTRKAVVLGACPVVVVLAIGGCKSLEEGAREAHSKAFSCPESRIQVKTRKDLDAYALIFGTDKEAPPADVKRDRERLALWQKEQRDKHSAWNGMGDLVEAKGCGHDVVYFCTHPNGNTQGENLAQASCSPTSHQPKSK